MSRKKDADDPTPWPVALACLAAMLLLITLGSQSPSGSDPSRPSSPLPSRPEQAVGAGAGPGASSAPPSRSPVPPRSSSPLPSRPGETAAPPAPPSRSPALLAIVVDDWPSATPLLGSSDTAAASIRAHSPPRAWQPSSAFLHRPPVTAVHGGAAVPLSAAASDSNCPPPVTGGAAMSRPAASAGSNHPPPGTVRAARAINVMPSPREMRNMHNQPFTQVFGVLGGGSPFCHHRTAVHESVRQDEQHRLARNLSGYAASLDPELARHVASRDAQLASQTSAQTARADAFQHFCEGRGPSSEEEVPPEVCPPLSVCPPLPKP
mmetsp:Transcript_48099/g.114479  ORF Transcript_48099/g.114479 Transcript_48099/m.114479 type:complete len:321 (+) Transcript_48099:154-1116(+)